MQNPVHDTPLMVYVCGKLAGFIKLLKPKLLHNSNVWNEEGSWSAEPAI